MSGWGAVVDAGSTGGFFSAEASAIHINILELMAALFGLRCFFRDQSNVHVKLLMDNTTAVQTVNKMGSCKSIECDDVVRLIWDFALDRNIWLSASYIPGILNVEADEESRKSETRTEWMLSELVFQEITEYLDF